MALEYASPKMALRDIRSMIETVYGTPEVKDDPIWKAASRGLKKNTQEAILDALREVKSIIEEARKADPRNWSPRTLSEDPFWGAAEAGLTVAREKRTWRR